MYILAGMLVLGLIANLLVRPLAERWFMKPEEVAALQAARAPTATQSGLLRDRPRRARRQALVAWLCVGMPIAWGVWITLSKAPSCSSRRGRRA